jgi:hypothetical protein
VAVATLVGVVRGVGLTGKSEQPATKSVGMATAAARMRCVFMFST